MPHLHEEKKIDYSEKLHKLGLKSTLMRIGLLECIYCADLPQDVQTISDHLKQNQIDFDKVTLYRNLETLVDKGVIKKIDLLDGRYYYEKADDCSHLICKNCGQVEHVHLKSLDDISKDVTKKTGFKISQQVSDFFGLCKKCN